MFIRYPEEFKDDLYELTNFRVTEEVAFKDKNLETCIRNIINRPTGTLFKSDVKNITTLHCQNVLDISGIENLVSLKSLILYGPNNKISDLSPLKGLNNLQELGLENNKITNISALQGLTNLQRLYLDNNQISNVSPLKGLTNLQALLLGNNKITNISALQGLINLQSLYLDKNQISDINPLKGLNNLINLNLSYNQISDISPLKGLTNLQNLYLGLNKISADDRQTLSNALPHSNIKW